MLLTIIRYYIVICCICLLDFYWCVGAHGTLRESIVVNVVVVVVDCEFEDQQSFLGITTVGMDHTCKISDQTLMVIINFFVRFSLKIIIAPRITRTQERYDISIYYYV
jgi:hypothetical protein